MRPVFGIAFRAVVEACVSTSADRMRPAKQREAGNLRLPAGAAGSFRAQMLVIVTTVIVGAKPAAAQTAPVPTATPTSSTRATISPLRSVAPATTPGGPSLNVLRGNPSTTAPSTVRVAPKSPPPAAAPNGVPSSSVGASGGVVPDVGPTVEQPSPTGGSRLRIGPSTGADGSSRLQIRTAPAGPTAAPTAAVRPANGAAPTPFVPAEASPITSAPDAVMPFARPTTSAPPVVTAVRPPPSSVITPVATPISEPGAVSVGADGSLAAPPATASSTASAPSGPAASPATATASGSGSSTAPAILPPATTPTSPSPSASTPAAAAPGTVATANTKSAIEPIDFNGVVIGRSTLDAVVAAWGEPRKRTDAGGVTRLEYVLEPFSSVEVTFLAGRAAAVVVDLGEAFPIAAVAEELGMEQSSPVVIEDDHGRPLGLVYPERGVAFRFQDGPGEPLVAQIGLDQIDARPFAMRAERRMAAEYQAALDDAAAALELDPNNGRAHYVRAVVLERIGRRREALAAVEAALKLDPKAPEYLLCRAGLLADAGMFDAALRDNELVINQTADLPQRQAQAWCQRGDLLADGPARDYAQAIDAHTRAVRLADPLLKDERPAVRRAAKETLIDAHLAVAGDVAWGNWRQKDDVVAKWLSEAEKLAADVGDGASPDYALKIDRAALAACVGVPGVDAAAWAAKLIAHTEAELRRTRDPLRRRSLQFEAGLGLYDALQALHARGDVDAALTHGLRAVEWVGLGREGREETPLDAYRDGRLYFRIGSLYAVERKDHRAAVEWFDRAAPLLERPLPEEAAADRGRQGETLVSMGVSYWAENKRERAVQLTTLGNRYMQQAVEEGSLEAAAMSVPWANLATMHRELGDEAAGRRYAEMAHRIEAPNGTIRR